MNKIQKVNFRNPEDLPQYLDGQEKIIPLELRRIIPEALTNVREYILLPADLLADA